MYSNMKNMSAGDIIKSFPFKNKSQIGKTPWDNINPIQGKSAHVERAFDAYRQQTLENIISKDKKAEVKQCESPPVPLNINEVDNSYKQRSWSLLELRSPQMFADLNPIII